MIVAAAWTVLVLGIGHMLFALRLFRRPLTAAVREGFVGKFSVDHLRRLSFWFFIFGPLLAMVGHLAISAAYAGDHHMLKIIGSYLLATAVVGTLALPKSPFWVALLIAPVLIAGGFGWIA